MRKFGLILATTALFGLTAPALAIDAGTSVKTRTPVAHADVNAGMKSRTGVKVRHSRCVNKMVQHDRGLHRGFTHSRHLGYAQSHHMARAKVHGGTSHGQSTRTTVGVGGSTR